MLTQHLEARRLFCYVAAAGVSASLAGYYSVNANLGRGVPGSQPGALLGVKLQHIGLEDTSGVSMLIALNVLKVLPSLCEGMALPRLLGCCPAGLSRPAGRCLKHVARLSACGHCVRTCSWSP